MSQTKQDKQQNVVIYQQDAVFRRKDFLNLNAGRLVTQWYPPPYSIGWGEFNKGLIVLNWPASKLNSAERETNEAWRSSKFHL